MKYEILGDTIYQTPEGVMEVRVQEVRFTKKKQGGETIDRTIAEHISVERYEFYRTAI